MSFADELSNRRRTDDPDPQGGPVLVDTRNDRRGRQWDLLAELDGAGVVLGGTVVLDGQPLYIGDYTRARLIFNGDIHVH